MFNLFRLCRKGKISLKSCWHCCQKRQQCRSNVRLC